MVLLQAVLDDELKPLADAIAQLLRQAEAYGRIAVDLWMVLPSNANVREQRIDNAPRELYVARELTVPADDDEIDGLALSWHRELQRAMGIVKYEDDQTR
jgi:hypothetical protein